MAIAVWGIVQFTAVEAGSVPPQGVFKQAIHWDMSADWFDPATIAGAGGATYFNMYLLHDALFKPMPDGFYAPCLAESWTVTPDSKIYEFRLRKGVKFHNGDPMTAEDVVFSFGRCKVGQTKFIYGRTEKVEAVNPYLVRFRFKESFPDFLDFLLPGANSMGWVVPKKYVEKVGDAGFKKQPVGCGPYKFVEFVPGVRLVVEAFEDFWRKVPGVKRLEFLMVKEPGTRVAMLRRGEIDSATLIQGVFYEDVKKDPKLALYSPLSPTKWVVYIAGQWDSKSPWSDARVRKAASLAIDRKTLADIHMPGCEGVGSIGLPGDPFSVQLPADPYDPERARKLLAEAGYPKGFQGGKFYPYEGGYWPYGEQVANYWKAIGISLEIRLLDRPAWRAHRDGGKMKGDLFVDNSSAPTIGGRLAYLLGSGAYGSYPDIQTLWEQYNKEADLKARKDLIVRIQNLIHERTMFIPLTNTNSPAGFGPKIKGNPYKIQPHIWYMAPFEDLEIK
jgi:peptide/nickel transport system substrate-binding protein